MNTNKKYTSQSLWLAVIAALCIASPALAIPILGSELASFTVLGATTVSNVPASSIVGNVGVWSSGGANAITGFVAGDSQVTGGSLYAGGALAESAQGQLTTARNNLASLGLGTLLGANLTGLTLAPGVYTVDAGTTNLSGALTLDGGSNANAAWIFQMTDTLITSPDSIVNLINTGPGAGVYWNVSSSATIDVNTAFIGNILALTNITFNTSATDFCGRALAATGAVTLDQNSLSGVCQESLAGSAGLSGGLDFTSTEGEQDVVSFLPFVPVNDNGTGGTSVPEPSTLMLLALGLTGVRFSRRRQLKQKHETK